MVLPDNSTLLPERIQNSERVFWIVYNLFIVISSLIGDTTILFATIKYNAVKLHKVIVAIIQHLAVCDLLQSLLRVTPIIISLVADHWILGQFMCVLQEQISSIGVVSTVLLTSYLALAKALTIKFPLKARAWTKRTAHKISGFIWTLCLVSPPQITLFYITTTAPNPVYFHNQTFTCNYNHQDCPEIFIIMTNIYLTLGLICGNLILISTSIYFLFKAIKAATEHSRTLPWQGISTVTLTSISLICSFSPYNIIRLTARENSDYSAIVWRTCLYLQNINIVSNFFIYSLTVKSFKEFLQARFRVVLSYFFQTRRDENVELS